ncbi:MAG: 23S rRNA (pseudouridine(1915)-N(3))-methyltransferase RlmH [Flavonifractor plautii]
MSAYCRSLWSCPRRLPKDPPAQIDAPSPEAAAIRAKLPKRCGRSLCVEGKGCSSEELAGLFTDWVQGETHLVFLIGGSFGLHLHQGRPTASEHVPHDSPTSPGRVMLLEQSTGPSRSRGLQLPQIVSYHPKTGACAAGGSPMCPR